MPLALIDEEIHTTRILLVAMAVSLRQAAVHTLSHIAKLENALGYVVIEERRTENFREFASGIAAQHIHLPKTVLSRNVALREEQIILAGCFDVRNAMTVAAN